jgi:hypothetical protein
VNSTGDSSALKIGEAEKFGEHISEFVIGDFFFVEDVRRGMPIECAERRRASFDGDLECLPDSSSSRPASKCRSKGSVNVVNPWLSVAAGTNGGIEALARPG